MNTTELIAAVREIALTDNDPDYPASAILTLLNKALIERFSHAMISARSGGYWRQVQLVPVEAGQATYPVPPRAVAGVVEKVEIQDGSSGPFRPLVPLTPGRTQFHQTNFSPAAVGHYAIDGDDITLHPAPTTTATLKITYFLRPGTMQTAQATTAGYVTDITGQVVTLSAVTTQVEDPGPPLITVAGSLATGTPVDIIRAHGRFETVLVGTTQTVSGGGLTLTFATGVDLSRVQIGDRVRQAGYTDWPQLPLELHQSLADYTAAVILANKGDLEKAKVYASKSDSAIQRVVDVVVPRAKAQPPSFIPRYSFLRRGRGRRG